MLRRSIHLFTEKILSKDFPFARLVTLNNPKALNALNLEMVEGLRKVYIDQPAPKTSTYILKGSGEKAFCAGGDVVSVVQDRPQGCAQTFFYREYQLDHCIMKMHQMQVALWNGYVMGGGVGLSLPGRYRVASEKACLAMPETAIGMCPDVGSTWFLPRLRHNGLGVFLGLVGHRLRGADLVHAGLATHYVPSERLPRLEDDLCAVRDPGEVNAVLARYNVSDLPPFTLAPNLSYFENVFHLASDNTMEKVIAATEAAAATSVLAQQALEAFRKMSPTSLCVALEAFKRGAALSSPEEAYRQEYCITQRLSAEGDFAEGVRALLIDKDKSPKWKPRTVAEVTPEHISSFFKPTFANQVEWDPVKPLSSKH